MSQAQATGVMIAPEHNAVTLGPEVWTSHHHAHFTDSALALAAYRRGEFVPYEYSRSQGFGPPAIWLAFDLAPTTSDTSDEWLIQTDPAHLDRVTAWLAMPDGSLRLLGTAGEQVNSTTTERPYLKPTFAFQPPQASGHSVLLRVENQGTHAAYLRLLRSS